MMEQFVLRKAVKRIERMERCFDTLYSAVQIDPAAVYENHKLKAYLMELMQYYEGGQWLRDYELDETGHLPADLKRGVLSQDAVFDFLTLISNYDR